MYATSLLVTNALLVLITIISTLPEVRVSRDQVMNETGLHGKVNSDVTFVKHSDHGEVMWRFFSTYPHMSLFAVEIALVVLISLDFCFRLCCAPSRIRFCAKLPSLFTLIGLAPVWIALVMMAFFFIEHSWLNLVALRAMHTLWLLRSVRVLAVVQMLYFYKPFKVIVLAVRESSREMALLVILICSGAILFGSLVFLADINEDSFWTIPDGIWWAIITMTTVGYGDKYPVSVVGKFVGVVCAMTGILIIALPIPIVANNFIHYHGLLSYVKDNERLKRKYAL